MSEEDSSGQLVTYVWGRPHDVERGLGHLKLGAPGARGMQHAQDQCTLDTASKWLPGERRGKEWRDGRRGCQPEMEA